jgi:hypothetical protein
MSSILRRSVVVGIAVLTLMAVTGSAASASSRTSSLELQTHV